MSNSADFDGSQPSRDESIEDLFRLDVVRELTDVFAGVRIHQISSRNRRGPEDPKMRVDVGMMKLQAVQTGVVIDAVFAAKIGKRGFDNVDGLIERDGRHPLEVFL